MPQFASVGHAKLGQSFAKPVFNLTLHHHWRRVAVQFVNNMEHQHKMKEWTNAESLDLIEMYRNYPCLWDSTSIEYKNRQAKHDLTEEMAVKFGVDKSEIERKIKNMVCHFLRETKKIRDSLKSNDIYESKWFAFHQMQFLRQDRNRLRTITGGRLQKTTERPLSWTSIKNSLSSDDIANDYEEMIYEGTPHKLQKFTKQEEDPLFDSSLSCDRLQSATECDKLQQPSSEYEQIATTWAIELGKMAPLQQLFAKKAINEILFEGQMGTLHRNSVQINKEIGSSSCSTSSSGPCQTRQSNGDSFIIKFRESD